MITIFQKDCKNMLEDNLWLYAEGVKWRIEVKMGEKELSVNLDTLYK